MACDISHRILEKELIDHIDYSDPRALRSRRDLRVIDFYLGNSRWITRMLRSVTVHSVVELGAGDGHLSRKLSRIHPGARITGLDLMPLPKDWYHPLHWIQGDCLKTIQDASASICIGSLVLHHFHQDELAQLAKELQRFSLLVFAETHRNRQSLVGSNLLQPFMGEIVRHDMPASILAGFRMGEIANLLQLSRDQWSVEESVTTRGAIRFLAKKNQIAQREVKVCQD